MSHLSRRQLIGVGGAALGGMLIGSSVAVAEKPTSDTKPWDYHQLDPTAAGKRGYAGFYAGRCCYGVFESIVGPLAEKYGAPYDAFPTRMLAYGKSGVAGFGTLCGALNGAAAAIGLFVGEVNKKDPTSKARDKLITELFTWYETDPLPQFEPTSEEVAANKGRACKMPATCAGSVLCHRSVGIWCEKADCGASSKERSERCARLTGDVAAKTVELLNAYLAGETPKGKPGEEAQSCLSCHGKGKDLDNAKSKMNCTVCHNDGLASMGPDHGAE